MSADSGDAFSSFSSDGARPPTELFMDPHQISPRLREQILSTATEEQLIAVPFVRRLRTRLDESQDTINHTSTRLRHLEAENLRLLAMQQLAQASGSSLTISHVAARSGTPPASSDVTTSLGDGGCEDGSAVAAYYRELNGRTNDPPAGAQIACFWTRSSVTIKNGAEMEKGVGNESKYKLRTVWRNLDGTCVDKESQRRISNTILSYANMMILQLPKEMRANHANWNLLTIRQENPDGYEKVIRGLEIQEPILRHCDQSRWKAVQALKKKVDSKRNEANPDRQAKVSAVYVMQSMWVPIDFTCLYVTE